MAVDVWGIGYGNKRHLLGEVVALHSGTIQLSLCSPKSSSPAAISLSWFSSDDSVSPYDNNRKRTWGEIVMSHKPCARCLKLSGGQP